MHVEIPHKLDWLKHQNMTELTPAQLARWGAICQLNDLLYMATKENKDPSNNRNMAISFTSFLESLYSAAIENSKCANGFLIDGYVDIALFCLPAMKHIVASPSTQIIKEAQKVPVSSLKQTTSKTMQWLSKRTGRTVQEKIAPQNKVMTNLTVFSADTKENRETIYLYKILYDIVSKRLEGTPCINCQKPCAVPLREINAIIALHTKIKKSELSDVPAQKQTIQNNKLMCDQYYKKIWDAVRMDSEQENIIKMIWEKMSERYMQIAYWLVLSILLHEKACAIYDYFGILNDDNGVLSFDPYNQPQESVSQNSIQIFPVEAPDSPLILSLQGNCITISSKMNSDKTYAYDFSEITEQI